MFRQFTAALYVTIKQREVSAKAILILSPDITVILPAEPATVLSLCPEVKIKT